MDIFVVWEVLRVEGKTFKVFVAFAQPETFGRRSFTEFGQSAKSKVKVALLEFILPDAGTNCDSAIVRKIGTSGPRYSFLSSFLSRRVKIIKDDPSRMM